ncbi:MAG TPA: hypothetical protein VGO18_34825 [Steroidobacteraceae bacterium]|nr:hypothetical protein [Steroidobacteraceae bacterium]
MTIPPMTITTANDRAAGTNNGASDREAFQTVEVLEPAEQAGVSVLLTQYAPRAGVQVYRVAICETHQHRCGFLRTNPDQAQSPANVRSPGPVYQGVQRQRLGTRRHDVQIMIHRGSELGGEDHACPGEGKPCDQQAQRQTGPAMQSQNCFADEGRHGCISLESGLERHPTFAG